MSTSTNSTFVSVRAILCIPKWAFPTKRMCKSCWSFCRSVMPFVNARGKSPFFHLFSYFSSFLLFPTLHSMCSPVQETYPDPQIVFKELKSLNVDNSDPENIKFTPKDWCLSCLGNLAILLHALGTGFRYFQIAFLGKTCWGFWNHTKSESWHESTWGDTGVQSLGQFLVPEEAVQRHTKITTPVSKTPRPLWRALWCHKEHSKMDSYAFKVTLLIFGKLPWSCCDSYAPFQVPSRRSFHF